MQYEMQPIVNMKLDSRPAFSTGAPANDAIRQNPKNGPVAGDERHRAAARRRQSDERQAAGRRPDDAPELGNSGYLGPCPPPGDHPHRYLFTLFAVGKDKLGVTADTSPAVVGFNLHFNTLAKAEIMGLYKR